MRRDTDALLYPQLAELVLKAFGPAAVLGEELGGVDGIDEAYVFGSWARRYLGDAGPAPTDIDLPVIGEPDMDHLADVVTRAGSRSGRAVGPTVLTPGEWQESRDGFVRAVRDGSRVPSSSRRRGRPR